MILTRRELLDLAVRAAALPGAAAFFSPWFGHALAQQDAGPGAYAPPEPPTLKNYKPSFFAADDFEALKALTEILIPTDDTPGAREAFCAHYIDFVLQAATGFTPNPQQQWRDAMAALRQAGFHAADAQGRAALVEAISLPERDRAATHPAYGAYRLIKQQNTFAFYTSRAGSIEALEYRGNSYNPTFPECNHPEHRTV
jgi:gluconate 2-dehydrogenase gamma chain